MDQKAPLLQSTLLVPQLQLLFFPFSFSSLEFPLLPQLFPLLQNTENISITNFTPNFELFFFASITHTYNRFLFGLFDFCCWCFWCIPWRYLFKLPFLRGGWNSRITRWIINFHFTVERKEI